MTKQCQKCGYPFSNADSQCPLCCGQWEAWELRLPPVPLQRNREQISAWLGQLPAPVAIEIFTTTNGIKIRLYTPPEKASGAITAWASMTHQQSRWEMIANRPTNRAAPRGRSANHVAPPKPGYERLECRPDAGHRWTIAYRAPAWAAGQPAHMAFEKRAAPSRPASYTGILFVRDRVGRQR